MVRRILPLLILSLLLPLPALAATLVTQANGNLTDPLVWAAADSTSLLNALGSASQDTVTTVYSGTRSQTFSTGIITIDGIGVKIGTRTGTTGTFSVELYNSSLAAAVAGTEVTINCSDFSVATGCETASTTVPWSHGWYFFKFAAPVTLLAATNYAVEVKTSSSSQINMQRGNATTDNMCRYLRISGGTNTPAASDNLIIAKEWTAAATGTARSVTMNSTATTSYGAAVSAFSVEIGDGGTLTYGTTASTNYILRFKGWMIVYSGGRLSIGTTGTKVPITSTAKLQLDCTADGDSGLEILGGTCDMQGVARTSGKNITYTLLNTDEAANSTSLGVADDTGWLDNDVIVAGGTSQTYTDTEAGQMNGDAGASTLTVDTFAGAGGGLAVAHSGTSPTQGEMINLTRNVVVESVSTTLQGYFYCKGAAAVDLDWTEFRYLGDSTTVRLGGVTWDASAGISYDMKYCSVHDSEDYGVYQTNDSATSYSVSLSYSVFYNLSTVASTSGVNIVGASAVAAGAGTVIDHCVFAKLRPVGASLTFNVSAASNITISNCYIVGCRGSTSTSSAVAVIFGNNAGSSTVFTNNVIHSNAGNGLILNTQGSTYQAGPHTISGCSIWRNASGGMTLGDSATPITVSTFSLWGNSQQNLGVYANIGGYWTLDAFNINSDTTFTTVNGFDTQYVPGVYRFYNCDFGTASGIKTANTNDINISSNRLRCQIYLNNTKLASAVEINSPTQIAVGGFISSDKHDQTAGSYYKWLRYGIQQRDTGLDHGSDGASERLTPNANTNTTNLFDQLASGPQTARCASGATKTFHVYVNKNASYNGGQPTLYLLRNDAMGITADTLLDTMTVGTGSWEELTGTTPTTTGKGVFTIEVRCNGTAGYINVDDWSVT